VPRPHFRISPPSRGLRVLLLALATSCGTDAGPAAPAETVASVVVAGAPAAPVLVGATVQLTATPLNASGVVVPNQTVTWRSSAPAVAAVSPGGLVTALAPGGVTITAEGRGGGSGTTSLDVRAGGPLGPDGGTLALLGGAVTVVAPPRGLAQTTTLLVRPAPAPPADPLLVPGTAYEIGPETLALGLPATLALRYDPARLPAGAVEAGLQLYARAGDAWTLVRGSTVNTANRTVTGSIARAGTYAVVGTRAARITLGGALLGGALYVGQSGRLLTTIADANGDVLSGRPVAWATSDARAVTVTDDGTVTAVGPGSATITATVDGKSAGTVITALPRVVPEWDQVPEWTTFQGNARHTGYVPATLDPGAFRERWVSTTLSGSALNPVTAADGAVFVSTTTYYGSQQLVVLDAGTGAPRWSRSFGGISGVHPPAYGNGTVYLTTSGHEDSFLWAFDALTGTPRFRSAYGNQWSRYYAPVVLGDAVYMAGGHYGGAYSFAAGSGAQRWFAATNQYDEWTPAVDGGRVYTYTGSYSPKVSVLDAATGKQLYEIPDPKFEWSGWSMHLAPVLGGADNLLATNGGRLLSFDLQARAIRWEQKAGFTGTVAVADGTVYVLNNGQVEARRESDGSLVGLWIPPEGRAQWTILLTRNLAFVGTAANTYAVDRASFRQVWSYPAAGHLAMGGDGTLYIAQANGKLAAIQVKP
jgi:outer membrane protein assembly factor BamB